jgi:hypothetical protein
VKSEALRAYEVVASAMDTAEIETKYHLRGRESERLAPVDADVCVWVYRSTVYSAKGTTWSGSPLWKETQREVRQHWFIYSYISVYIQALYMYCPGLLEYIR